MKEGGGAGDVEELGSVSGSFECWQQVWRGVRKVMREERGARLVRTECLILGAKR